MFDIDAAILWFAAGILLVLAELFIPGLVVVFFGFGAILTGFVTWLWSDMTVTWQIIVFIAGSIGSLLLLRRYFKTVFFGKSLEEGDTRNFNLEVGKIVKVVSDIYPDSGQGRVRYQGAEWNATADQAIPAGTSVRITGQDNLTLIVEPAGHKPTQQ